MALTVNQQVIAYAQGSVGKPVGDGECWTFAEKALESAGAKTSRDIMGPNIGPDADYVWGDKIPFKDIIAGDILQFRDYAMTTKTVVSVLYQNLPSGVTIDPNPVDESEDEESFEQSHHTSIVSTPYAARRVSVLHQNVPPKGKKVQSGTLALETIPTKETVTSGTRKLKVGGKEITVNVKISTKVTVSVEGTIWAYRPKRK
jgi:hypothetical protein